MRFYYYSLFLFIILGSSLYSKTEIRRKVSAEKAYFYRKPYLDTKKSSYLLKGQEFAVHKTRTAWLYTEYTNEKGKITKGWINEFDVYLYEIVSVENVGVYADTSFTFTKLKYYPNKSILSQLNQQFRNLTISLSKEFITDKEVKESLEETQDLERISALIENYDHGVVKDSKPVKFHYKINQEVVLLKKNIMVIKMTKLIDQGDENSKLTTQFYNYNMATAKQLELQDLFPPNYEVELKNHAIEHIQSNFQDECIKKTLSELKFQLTNNFFIENEGLGFYYNSQEFSPGCKQDISFMIPYKKIANLILLGGPIGWTVPLENNTQ
ncbi:MAG: hypothetical protein KDK90_12920 [Leptospiraceae bacterium]|nr:hypothetical protein [Leptospiraceae bacterium]